MTSAAILDSGVVIGCFVKNDQYKGRSDEIMESIAMGDIRRVYVTESVVVETVNFLLRKAKHRDAMNAADLLLSTDNIRVVYLDKPSAAEVRQILDEYPGLSWTDCSLVYLSRRFGVKRLFSFDKLFDRVKGIERLEHPD